MNLDIDKQLDVIRKGAVRIVSEEELVKKLKTGKPLRVKLGVDPTAPDIHLGHTVVLRKLRQFQDLGHQAVLIIGGFTAMIGDPTGRVKTRPPLSAEEVKANAETYLNQVRRVLDVNRLEIVNNAQWLSPISLGEFIKLAMGSTAAKLLQREDFAKRLEQGIPIHFHELMYPFLQGYDSVHVRADVELGGTDQLLNILFGRDLQKDMGQESQVALVMPILVGTDGHDKMSKSLGNYIGVTEPAFEMFSKVMSIPDTLMKDYTTLLTSLMPPDLSKTHPREAKMQLAREITAGYHSAEAADQAAARWEQVMSRKEVPSDIPELALTASELEGGRIKIVALVAKSGVVKSNSDARRLVEQGGVELDSQKVTDPNAMIDVKSGAVLRVGKKNKYFRLVTG